MGRSIGLGLSAALVVLGSAACAGDADERTATSSPSSTSSGPTAAEPTPAYTTHSFRPALTVEPPSWLPPAPSTDEEHFLTWTGEGADVDRAVRFTSPVGLYDPGHPRRRLRPLPKDYIAYLMGLEKYGADITTPTEIEVGGHHATLVTASTNDGLDGSLGCQEPDQVPTDCFGLQDFALLHLAVIDVDGSTVLAWARVVRGAPYLDQDFAAFETMLRSVHFR